LAFTFWLPQRKFPTCICSLWRDMISSCDHKFSWLPVMVSIPNNLCLNDEKMDRIEIASFSFVINLRSQSNWATENLNGK
jgi:hypothetical protein